ncbi:MAG: plasmid stabilization protein [Ignavibacteria bacterium GWB2_35_12]|nr:MAG: plasmid stabilization protein [Ignavibacteria bacterium GWA2_35_8]OGU41634.1 MAG: plasmid stabilization protein [Ignavibacteria bacterium GWB2_35_12]OGU91374.1 MAG: plasmid stabilization protein [Ignavibacteria bacterium RIFOXYA2_FULL_35_10]OGV24968.1 MAG: plasmid stabilization protein [Ignavibacteria bacterium RIFOXYC2_FULL_35_21]
MTEYKLIFTKTFLKELYSLPELVRTEAEKIVFNDLRNISPFDVGNIEKLKGYQDKYKIRIGDYRIGLTLEKNNKRIIFQRVAHRKDIYKLFP